MITEKTGKQKTSYLINWERRGTDSRNQDKREKKTRDMDTGWLINIWGLKASCFCGVVPLLFVTLLRHIQGHVTTTHLK